MPKISNITLVTIENFHEVLPDFIKQKKILISSYEDMMETILQMIQENHLFNMDR